MYQSETTETSNPRYVGKRLEIINTKRAQGHCNYPIQGRVLVVTCAVIYADQQPEHAWVSGYIEGAIHPEWDLPVVVGLPVAHTQSVEEGEAQKKPCDPSLAFDDFLADARRNGPSYAYSAEQLEAIEDEPVGDEFCRCPFLY